MLYRWVFAAVIFIHFATRNLLFAIPGWYEAAKLDSGVLGYAAAVDPADGLLYYVTEKILRNGRALYLHIPGNKNKPRLVGETAANLRMNPTLAVHNGVMLIAWQHLLPGANVAVRWLYSGDGGQNFLPPGESTGRDPNRPLLLPRVAVDGQGNMFLFAQQEITVGRMTLLVASGRAGVFSSFTPLVTEKTELGRGVFFPSIVAHDGIAYVFYQGRQEKSLTDELFSIQIASGTLAFKGPDRLTKNDYQDYAPFAVLGPRGLEWVWQSNQEKNWQVMHAGSEEPRRTITHSRTNAYQPSLVILEDSLRIISWLDFRQTPPQVYAIFPDRDPDLPTAREHNVSESRVAAENPLLVGFGNTGYLLYQSAGNLYARRIDNRTEKITLSSRTHPSDKAVSASRGEFRWDVANEISGIDAVGYIVNERPMAEVPLYNGNPNNRTIIVDNLPGGRYYLHFRYRDKAGNESPVATYPFIIDNQIPSQPRISSATHQENSVSKVRNIEFNLESIDDSGIRGFYYDLSNKAEGRLKNYTTKNFLRFGALADGVYFFRVQAEDLAGNLSDISVFQFEISPHDQSTLVVSSNLVNGYPLTGELVLQVADATGRQLTAAQYTRGKVPGDPQGESGELTPVQRDNGYVFVLPWKSGKSAQEVISVRFRYADGEWSGSYHLMIGGMAIHRSADRVAIASSSAASEKKNLPRLSIKPTLKIRQGPGGIEIEFNVPDIYRDRLKGYQWSLNDTLPADVGQINSLTGREILASLPPGEHLLRVRPVFRDKKITGEILETSVMGAEVPPQPSSTSVALLFFGAVTIGLVIFISLFGMKRIRYLLSIFRSA